MQTELDATTTQLPVQILGINAIGEESGNPDIIANRTLPWLQDTPDQDAWSAWQATWRDVVIADPKNDRVKVYNLTPNDLAKPENYATLKGFILAAANAQ